MSSIVSPFDPPPPIRSVLFKNPPETVPPTDDLEDLQYELRMLKDRALERARKAGEDIKSIEESMRRLKEREKGKAKALEKVKRERGFTPLPNGDDARHSSIPQATLPRNRPPSVTITAPPPSATPSIESRKSMTEEQKKKKKKRKRDDLSDVELEPQKIRKPSPLPPPIHSHTPSHSVPPPPKPVKVVTSSHPKAPNATEVFHLPHPVNLVPTRPPIQSPPIPGPSKPEEVNEDFTKHKQPSQILIGTFYTSIEPWTRSIKEEDIGFLEFVGDELEPFVMPKLGRHYTEVWEEEDTAVYGGPLPGTAATRPVTNASGAGPLPRWEPSTLMENDLVTEERAHGPLTERLVSALIPVQNLEWKGVKAAEEAMEGRPGTNGAAAAAARDRMNVADLEERVKNVMQFYSLIDNVPDFSDAVDDPISTALRHCQRELRTVLATNKLRRARLVDIARDRLGYQEYLDLRDSVDKNLTTLYAKLQKKDGPKSKHKKKKSEPNGTSSAGSSSGIASLPPCPAAIGLGPDDNMHLTVPDSLKRLVQMRRQWVDTIGKVFDEKQQEHPGRIWGLPPTSVFEGIDEEVMEILALPPGPPSAAASGPSHAGPSSAGATDMRTLKGKARANGDDMELG